MPLSCTCCLSLIIRYSFTQSLPGIRWRSCTQPEEALRCSARWKQIRLETGQADRHRLSRKRKRAQATGQEELAGVLELLIIGRGFRVSWSGWLVMSIAV